MTLAKAIVEVPTQAIVEAPVVVRQLTPGMDQAWDNFVLSRNTGTLFHLTGWKRTIERTFEYKSCYVYAERGGVITGVAPVFLVSNWVMGRCLISTPFAVYGGICAADDQSEIALIEHLKELARVHGVEFLELRCRQNPGLSGFSANRLYVTFTTALHPNPETMLKGLPRDTRYMIRKASKADLRCEQGMHQLDVFYRLFSQSMRRLGTPVLPSTLFRNFSAEFGASSHLLVVYSGSEPISGVFSFIFRDTILPYYAGASPQANGLAGNNFMYWELMKYAAQQGLHYFDFGRSKRGTGSYAFKMQWNTEVQPLDYQVLLVRRKDLPNFSPVNPKFELAARLWRRIPLRLTKWMGPRVVRWFP